MYNREISMKKIAQVGGMASVPGQMPGATNIPLNNLAAQQSQNFQQPVSPNATTNQGNTQPANSHVGLDPRQAIGILQKIANAAGSSQMQSYVPIVYDLMEQMSNPEFTQDFNKLINLMQVNSDIKRQTRDPETGNKLPLAQDVAQNIIKRIQQYMNTSEQNKEKTNNPNLVQAANKSKDPDTHDKKKKTRGNPFKVLMGQVGKLLDHGLGKSDITKYIERKGYWNKENIGRAIDLVKDYNKKKRKKDKEKKSSFNLKKRILIAKREIDDFKPEWDKRSTAELFARKNWIDSALNFNDDIHNEGRVASDLTGLKTELKEIKSELKKRGFKDSEI